MDTTGVAGVGPVIDQVGGLPGRKDSQLERDPLIISGFVVRGQH